MMRAKEYYVPQTGFEGHKKGFSKTNYNTARAIKLWECNKSASKPVLLSLSVFDKCQKYS